VEEDIEGIGLPREALERIYRANAERLLGLKLPEER
jgi:predicted TIM-barrel fold metal-dependent hydrolase